MIRKPFTLLAGLLAAIAIEAQTVEYSVPIGYSEDDAEEFAGAVDLTDLNLEVGWSYGDSSIVGLYFRDMHLDAGSSVDDARLVLTLQQDLTAPIGIRIRIEDAVAPLPYSMDTGLLAGRTDWMPWIVWYPSSGLKGDTVRSPDLSHTINLLLDDAAWTASSSINFVLGNYEDVEDSTELLMHFYSYNQNDASKRPTLVLSLDSNFINGVSNKSEDRFRVYPNPTSDVLFVEGLEPNDVVALYDISGVRCLQHSSNSAQLGLSIEQFAPGAYTLMITRNGLLREARRVVKF